MYLQSEPQILNIIYNIRLYFFPYNETSFYLCGVIFQRSTNSMQRFNFGEKEQIYFLQVCQYKNKTIVKSTEINLNETMLPKYYLNEK